LLGWEARLIRADALDVAQNKVDWDRGGSPEASVDGPGAVRKRLGLQDEVIWAKKLSRNWLAWVHAMRRQNGEQLELML